MRSERQLPADNALTHPFFEGALAGELRTQQCTRCAHRWFPPSTSCPGCLSTEFTWEPVSGRGTVWSWIVMHRPYLPGFQDEVPYPVAFVQLEEGPFLMCAVTAETTSQLACDLPVEVTFEEFGDGVALPVFAARVEVAS